MESRHNDTEVLRCNVNGCERKFETCRGLHVHQNRVHKIIKNWRRVKERKIKFINATEGKNYIICMECGNKYKEITKSHLNSKYCTGKCKDFTEYNTKYPSISTICEELKKRRSEYAKDQWKSMSTEEYNLVCQEMSQGHKKWWKEMHSEQRAYILKCFREGFEIWYKNLSPEQRIAKNKVLSKSHDEWLKRDPFNRKNEWAEGTKKQWNEMSLEEYESICKSMSTGQIKRWKEMSLEQYVIECRKKSRIWKKFWENVSLEEKNERITALFNGLRRHGK